MLIVRDRDAGPLLDGVQLERYESMRVEVKRRIRSAVDGRRMMNGQIVVIRCAEASYDPVGRPEGCSTAGANRILILSCHEVIHQRAELVHLFAADARVATIDTSDPFTDPI